MFETLTARPADKILELMQMLRNDPRPNTIDLGVGVYKDASGNTPVMRAVKTAQMQLWEREKTKTYTALAGDVGYLDAMRGLVLGDSTATARVACAATPGGTGALHMGFELIKAAHEGATVWVSAPTWPNHPALIGHVGLKLAEYRYFDAENRAVDFDGMIADLARIPAGDVVLLHGCCHNPTGANLNTTQWAEVAQTLQKTGALPFIDIAYQGFGDGLDADAAGVRLIAAALPETLIAASCSKNFGIYRERTGILMAVGDSARQSLTQGMLATLNRLNFSFPPDHGARLVTMILNDADLRADWQDELESMRRGMLDLRQALAQELQRLSGSDRFGFLAQHRGMFSRLGASPAQVETLRRDHGIYMVGDSRMNIAGLNMASLPVLARAIIETGI